jgi:AAA family ATP:ADP antiporter
MTYFLGEGMSKHLAFTPILSIAIFNGIMVILIYRWINANVLTDPRLYSPDEPKRKEEKSKTISEGKL